MKIDYALNPDFPEFESTVSTLTELFEENSQSIHKARNELKIVELHGQKTVVKSFKIPHIINRIVYTYFRSSKASNSYFNAMRLKQLNISTPEPIEYAEFYSSNLLKNSYFVTLHYLFDFTIREALHHKMDDYEPLLRAFAAFTYDLHQKGVWHQDYSPGNILIKRLENGYQFSIVDINRMKFREISPLEGCENFNKLWASDEDIIIMAQEYARLCGLDEKIAIAEMQRHNNANKRIKNFKKRLKALFK